MAGFFEPALNEGAAEADMDAEARISISGSDSTEMIRAVAKFIASQDTSTGLLPLELRMSISSDSAREDSG